MDSALSVPAEMPDAAADLAATSSLDRTAAGSSATSAVAPAAERSLADRRMRRILRLPTDAPRESIFGTESIFGKSIAVSAVRCLVTYVFLPLLAPIMNLSGVVGPILGLVLGLVSAIAITVSMRRFFAADHKYRWYYAGVGCALYVALAVAAVVDIRNLVG